MCSEEPVEPQSVEFLLLIVALTQQTNGLIQSTSACIGLKGYKAYMLMELRISVGYCSDWQGQVTGTVGYDEMRGAHSRFLWKEGHPWEVLVRGSPPAPSRISVHCFANAFGRMWAYLEGINASFSVLCRLLLDVSRRLEDPRQ